MVVKKLGEAVIDLDDELWFVEGRRERYLMNPRMVEKRPEVKAYKSRQAKMVPERIPSRREPTKRKAFFDGLEAYRRGLRKILTQVYEEIQQESFEYPVPLQKSKDHDHHRRWLFCLYKGCIYQFDRPNYATDEMMSQVEAFEEKNQPQ